MLQLKRLLEIFIVSTKLGLTSFGGPIAHLGYFREEYVVRRKWLEDKSYADLVALCQFLPGPASSQVGIGIGAARAGVAGGLVSFIGFTLPSVLALIIFVYIAQTYQLMDSGFIQGLKVTAVAVVAHAILGMAGNLAPDMKRKTIVLIALLITLLIPHVLAQVSAILLAGAAGWFLFKGKQTDSAGDIHIPLSKRFGTICLTIFFSLLIGLPLLSGASSATWISIFDSFYRSGSLVFGGGHVVLPLLEREFVPTGLISAESFLAGYGAAQAVPGPLFTFAAYIGADMGGWLGGLGATAAIFLPAILLIFGTLPFWMDLQKNQHMKAAVLGINAAVVGILISAFYQPIWTTSILTVYDFSLAALLFFMLAYWKLPPWVVVVTGAVVGQLLAVL
ncbi:chromate efflux transporter [Alkalicoccobacillus porphyridii]|uniref:Chromate efflux transporter n=1 Tax=Alkalicoccobacillus porphyridii TaxID=2597270 RepID=A0A553ZX95_9BACI|nr:chromate efflux transporter [Alkalicoccobacillus porphyridii]TSB45966.1 chromate efflux transporter [Alkalicoccobacillus porphyridii]